MGFIGFRVLGSCLMALSFPQIGGYLFLGGPNSKATSRYVVFILGSMLFSETTNFCLEGRGWGDTSIRELFYGTVEGIFFLLMQGCMTVGGFF